MSLKDILAIIVSPTGDEPALKAADALAARFGAQMAVAHVTALPDEPLAYEPSVVAGVWAELLGRARAEAAAERAALTGRLDPSGQPIEVRPAEALARDVGRVAAVHARYADLAVLTRPFEGDERGLRQELVEGVLYHSGRPALIVPPHWAGAEIGRRPILAWDASREATRALSEADMFIDGAEHVTVVTVDAKPKAFGHGEQPGANIAAHLARRGASVAVENIESERGGTTQALLAACKAARGDLMIMGAYGAPRLLEMVFGGATRDLLASADIPLLMAH